MIRLALLAILGLATLGCSSSHKVVVRNGYPGAPPPPGFEVRPAPVPIPAPTTAAPPGPIRYAPDAPGAAGPVDLDGPASPPAPANP